MHKIITPGNIKPKTKPIYEATCGCCGCKFEFDDDEIVKRTKNLGIPNTVWVNCPCCGNELEINYPKVVREEEIKDNNNTLTFKINHKPVSKLFLPDGSVIIDKEEYAKMKEQLEVIRNKVMPLVRITGHYDPEEALTYKVSCKEENVNMYITKEEYDSLLDLKRGNKKNLEGKKVC